MRRLRCDSMWDCGKPQAAAKKQMPAFGAPASASRKANAIQRIEFDATCEEVTPTFQDAGTWLNLDSVTQPLFAGEMSGQDWAQLATASGVWVVLPLVVGTYRVLTREVK